MQHHLNTPHLALFPLLQWRLENFHWRMIKKKEHNWWITWEMWKCNQQPPSRSFKSHTIVLLLAKNKVMFVFNTPFGFLDHLQRWGFSLNLSFKTRQAIFNHWARISLGEKKNNFGPNFLQNLSQDSGRAPTMRPRYGLINFDLNC